MVLRLGYDRKRAGHPAGTTLVGAAHTHTSETEFSSEEGGDISTYMFFNPPLFGFLATPPRGNRVLMFNPILYGPWAAGAPGARPPVCVLAGAKMGVLTCH